MTAREFCYWLQGKFELDTFAQPLTSEQVDIIRRHLALVFAHDIDPKAGGPEVQQKLNAIHHGPLGVSAFDKDTKLRC